MFYGSCVVTYDTHLRLEEYAATAHSRVICKTPERGQGEQGKPHDQSS